MELVSLFVFLPITCFDSISGEPTGCIPTCKRIVLNVQQCITLEHRRVDRKYYTVQLDIYHVDINYLHINRVLT
jgi:hypothetical protein